MLNGYESDTTMLTQFKTHISNFNVRQVKKVYLCKYLKYLFLNLVAAGRRSLAWPPRWRRSRQIRESYQNETRAILGTRDPAPQFE